MRRHEPKFWARRRKGIALVEMAMIVPLIALIIGLTFFFGWSLTNQQHVRAADRYEAWHEVVTGAATPTEQINQWFFQDKTSSLNVSAGPSSNQTLQAAVDRVNQKDAAAGQLAQTLFLQTFPQGASVQVSAAFPSDVALWNQFGLADPMSDQQARDGVEWRRGQARCETAVSTQFLTSLDSSLTAIAGAGAKVASDIRQLYLNAW